MAKIICNSCKTEIANQRGSTCFKCPQCSDYEIVRCKHCREIASKYTCPSCGFSGPN